MRQEGRCFLLKNARGGFPVKKEGGGTGREGVCGEFGGGG